MKQWYDVVVVGAGNAALCAALAARESGATVLVLERAPYEHRGGNTAFTAGVMRTTYSGVDDILALSPDLSKAELEMADFGTYSANDFIQALAEMTDYRADPDLAEVLATNSFATLKWMRSKGVRFIPSYSQQTFKRDGKFVFPDGLCMEVSGGGVGLIESLTRACTAAGVEIVYGAAATSLITEGRRVTGVRVRLDGQPLEVRARSVVLACGGFGANAEWRARYLGPGWDLAKVRGSRFNTGDGLRMALEANAMPWGHWSGVHAVGWDVSAPAFGDRTRIVSFQKNSYLFGILVNRRGERFFDEGAHFRSHTAALLGPAILAQPGHSAWQVFDSKVAHLLGEEYRIREVTKVRADSLEELAARMGDIDRAGFLRTVAEFNKAVRTDVPFDPNVLDGRSAVGLPVPKSNWANTLDTPPYEAYAVTTAVTFTFGGLRITPLAEVVDTDHVPIPGLYACGEMVGGLFYTNYVDGAGLTSGAVFGRIAGTQAARTALSTHEDS